MNVSVVKALYGWTCLNSLAGYKRPWWCELKSLGKMKKAKSEEFYRYCIISCNISHTLKKNNAVEEYIPESKQEAYIERFFNREVTQPPGPVSVPEFFGTGPHRKTE